MKIVQTLLPRLFFLVIFVFSFIIQPSYLISEGGGETSTNSLDINYSDSTFLIKSFQSAEKGNFSDLFRLANDGGEGAWYALSEIGEELGYSRIVERMRKESTAKDSSPFAARSLSALLLNDPRSLYWPLLKLKKEEKRSGLNPLLRKARIHVLSSKKRISALVREIEGFQGEGWESPILLAYLTRGKLNQDFLSILKRYILYCSDPKALKILKVEALKYLRKDYQFLMKARIDYAEGNWEKAAFWFDQWLLYSNHKEILLPGKIIPVFSEIRLTARGVEKEEDWADKLMSASERFQDSMHYGASYEAGKLYLRSENPQKADTAFLQAMDFAPNNLEKDRALWYRLKAVYNLQGKPKEKLLDAVLFAAKQWSRPHRFEDRLETYIHHWVRQGDWNSLFRAYQETGRMWDEKSRAQAALALGFAVTENRLKGKAQSYFQEAFRADPLSWSGLRAAGLLESVPPIASSPGQEKDGPEDVILRLFLRWGLVEQAYERVLSKPEHYSDNTVRMVSKALASQAPRRSIRIIGLLRRRDGYSPGREDLRLYYPLPSPYKDKVLKAVQGTLVNTEMFYGLIRTESAWDTDAVSRSGAMGLTQFMPRTWEEWTRRMDIPSDSNPMNPDISLMMGVAYLEWLYKRYWTFGWFDVLVSYNAGGGRLRGWRKEKPGFGEDLFGYSVPVEEPRKYIRKVLSAATLYGYLYRNTAPVELHKQWNLVEVKGLLE